MHERVKKIPNGADQLIAQLEALAKPLIAAISTARRLREIALPVRDDERIGAGLFEMASGFRKIMREPIAATERFAGQIARVEKAAQDTADRVPWHQRGEI